MMFNIGPPKHADRAIIGYPIFAIVRLETRSPREFPIAKTVRPKMASEIWYTVPSIFSTATTSLAMVETQEIEIKKPKNETCLTHVLGNSRLGGKTKSTPMRRMKEAIAEPSSSDKSGSLPPNPINETNKGASKDCVTKSHRETCFFPWSFICSFMDSALSSESQTFSSFLVSYTGTVMVRSSTDGAAKMLLTIPYHGFPVRPSSVGKRVKNACFDT